MTRRLWAHTALAVVVMKPPVMMGIITSQMPGAVPRSSMLSSKVFGRGYTMIGVSYKQVNCQTLLRGN